MLFLGAPAEQDLPGFEEVYTTYAGKMLGVALGVLHSRALAEEAVHEAFIKIIKNYQKFLQIDGHKQAGWIVIIIRNTALDMLRREKKELPLEYVNATSLDPGEGELVAEVAGLPAIYRDTLSLRYVYGYSLGETARLLGISYGAAAKRTARARAMLRRALADSVGDKRAVNNGEAKGTGEMQNG